MTALLDINLFIELEAYYTFIVTDFFHQCHSGHMGLPLGCAEIGAQLWGKHLSYNPDDPQWLNRDRFILSAGHGSMFIYSWLHLAGYALPLEEVKNFRRHHSMTPGHPEFPSSEHNTPGIEATTGPLGAGIGNAVGMAAAAKVKLFYFNVFRCRIRIPKPTQGSTCTRSGLTNRILDH